ncbi:hypothetical protein AALB53_20560 [Lachnospiraceae bacterium 47-T17]
MTEEEKAAYPAKQELYELCGKQGVPIVAMKPFAAGNILKNREEGRLKGLLNLTPVQCISYVLSFPQVACPVPGFAGESHAWKIVMPDGEFYNVDTTWDDTGDGTYEYFNKTDEDYAGNHIRQELSAYLPPCNGQAYRNLEREAEDSGLRSLADLGLTDEQVITDMEGYYKDCYEQIYEAVSKDDYSGGAYKG